MWSENEGWRKISIIIKGMKMPKNEELWIRVQPDGSIVSQTGYIIKGASAKLVSQHGRLIDADALKVMMPTIGDEYLYAREMIEEAPTIIEEEDEE